MRNTISVGDLKKLIVEKKDEFKAVIGDGVESDNKKNNAGIGLSVCASIIKAHGGEIKAENARGGGALFRFTLNMED